MNSSTISYYDANADKLGDYYLTAQDGISLYFQHLQKGKVLDVGFGSGRDLNILYNQGYDTYGVDASSGFVKYAGEKFPHLKDKISVDSLPSLTNVSSKFESIICTAVLMHLSNDEIFNSIFRFRELLEDNGKLLLSIPIYENSQPVNHHNVFLNQIIPNKLILLCERIGFRLINKWCNPDSLGRVEKKWLVLLFNLDSNCGTKPISIIESIINKDKKVATYKLALIRSIADIANNNYNSVLWHSNNKVHIPIDFIVDKWIKYYWPIFESKVFIPQIQNESIEFDKPVAFRKPMLPIINHYKSNDGFLSRFIMDLQNNSVPSDMHNYLNRLRQIIKRTIIDGPIKHSGGIDNDIDIFTYNKQFKCLELSSDLWKEFVLMGSWIYDASLLRWAELTKKLSKDEVSAGHIIDLLTMENIDKRDVLLARNTFKNYTNLECAWSGKELSNSFDIDHVIPYSLWYNNDLWNLLPTSPQVNNQKRDRLPTRNIIVKRKDVIIDYWKIYKENYPIRFFNDSARFTGENTTNENWENSLFNTLAEAVEYTALKRGISRWEP
ncbi:MAG TPA: methyltransferase domain-containing protein [Bacteroidales bacterium]|nr:methyltransferase domain-containing protein [Bacteroidales bacterium]